MYRAKAKDKTKGVWVTGDKLQDDSRTYIHPANSTVQMADGLGILSMCEVEPETLGRCLGKEDVSGKMAFEGDIIEIHQGTQILYDNFIIKYGTYQAYCPVDDCFMDSIGFYIAGKGYPDMPVGPFGEYAKIIGNITDNPERILLDFLPNRQEGETE